MERNDSTRESSKVKTSSTEWGDYKKLIEQFNNDNLARIGFFAKTLAQRHYELCLAYPLESWKPVMPFLNLPLRINLIRSSVIGCSSDGLHEAAIRPIVQEINTFWEQAKICFDLVQVVERECNLSDQVQHDLSFFIKNKLQRGKNGQMMNKGERREKFLGVLLSSFQQEESSEVSDTRQYYYDIWFMDMVGQGSQGMCIDRKNRTIIMGERSTKGYKVPTRRPHHCLAKTAAHELGHALTLNHPKGQVFEDGNSQLLSGDEPNLMSGGADRRGGGGYFLEDWQISQARSSAEKMLELRSRDPHTHQYEDVTYDI